MIEAITGGLGSIKAALEAVKGINAAVTEVKIAEAKSEIIGNLLTVQQAMGDALRTQLENADTIRALEAEIVRLKDWSAEAEGYELADAGQGSLAYRLKGANAEGQPSHWLCPTCFTNRKKSVLQTEKYTLYHTRMLACPPCGTKLLVHGVMDALKPQPRR